MILHDLERRSAPQRLVLGTTALLSLLTAACGTAVKDVGFDTVQTMVEERAQLSISRQGADDEPSATDATLAEETLSTLLDGELTLDRAVQIALLNNRHLQAEYEELGISKAMLVQAGLAANPVLLATARFPDEAPRRAQLDLGLVQNLLDLLVRPARKQLASTQFERTQLRVADAVLGHAAHTETAWLEAVSAQQTVDMRQLIRDSAQASYELAIELQRAGNASELEVARERGLFESSRIELARAESQAASARERLNRELGLWGEQIAWTAPSRLPEVPPLEIPLGELESHAIEQRLDLQALGKTVEASAMALGIKRRWRYLLSADVGVEAEREGDEWAIGPSLDLELPIFDRGQAELLSLRSELRQAEHELQALAVDIRSEVRELRDRLVLQRDLAEHYRTVVIPLRERTVELTQEQYNFMLVGAFELLVAKQEEFDTYEAYIEAVRDYHLIKTELKKALGGSLPRAGGEETS